jgi:hypothetical protein
MNNHALSHGIKANAASLHVTIDSINRGRATLTQSARLIAEDMIHQLTVLLHELG